jgi:hypothetical protein
VTSKTHPTQSTIDQSERRHRIEPVIRLARLSTVTRKAELVVSWMVACARQTARTLLLALIAVKFFGYHFVSRTVWSASGSLCAAAIMLSVEQLCYQGIACYVGSCIFVEYILRCLRLLHVVPVQGKGVEGRRSPRWIGE